MKRMMVPAVGMLAAILLAGCGSQKGETLFTAGPNSSAVNGKAPQDGTYALYTGMSMNPTVTVALKQGDKMGFRKTADGRIEAYWNAQSHAFTKGTSQVYWKIEK